MKLDPTDRPLIWALGSVALALMLNWTTAANTPSYISKNADAGIGLSGNIKRQASETFWQKTERDPINFFTAMLAIFTVALVGASVWQGRLTRQSIELARAEFLATHRPRIKIRKITTPDSVGENGLCLSVTVVNAGESSATMMETQIWARIQGSSSSCDTNFGRIEQMEILLRPGERHEFFRKSSNPINDYHYKQFRNETAVLIVQGRLTYSDDAGLIRNTGFSRQYSFSQDSYGVYDPHGDQEYED